MNQKLFFLLLCLLFVVFLSSCNNTKQKTNNLSSENKEINKTEFTKDELSETNTTKEESEKITVKSNDKNNKPLAKVKNKSLILVKTVGAKDYNLKLEYTNNSPLELGYFSDYNLFLYNNDKNEKLMPLIIFDEAIKILKQGETFNDTLDLISFFGELSNGKYILVKCFYENENNEILVKSEFFVKNGKIILAEDEYKEQIKESKIREIVLEQAKYKDISRKNQDLIKNLLINANWEVCDFDMFSEDYIEFENGLKIGILSAKENSLRICMQGGVKYLLTDVDNKINDLIKD